MWARSPKTWIVTCFFLGGLIAYRWCSAEVHRAAQARKFYLSRPRRGAQDSSDRNTLVVDVPQIEPANDTTIAPTKPYFGRRSRAPRTHNIWTGRAPPGYYRIRYSYKIAVGRHAAA
eukprot:4222320-Amphidinium_carterae.1